MDEARSRLIFAADYPSLDVAENAIAALRGHIGIVKVGLELYTRHGSDALALGEHATADVFLDLKLHDIPATVGRAVENVARVGGRVTLLTVHASGGAAMLRAAVEAAADALDIVAVTVLTSLDEKDLAAMGVRGSCADQALRLAELGWLAGVRAFVCSPSEAPALRKALGGEALLITPGVRPTGSDPGDQKRVDTPQRALRAGADKLVVGRPIRDAADPAAAADAIVREIGEALRDR